MTEQVEPQPARKSRYGVPSIVIAIVAALLYAYVLWGAIGNLIQLPKELGALTPWWLLVVDVVVPVVVYIAAILLGLRRRILTRAVLFVIGATVLGCCTVGSIAFVQTH